ncbi:adenylate/guanylate cyclase domain-containing protein [Capillimicrobium parvum]|uniref:Aminoacrylate hydrolase RutD n=1 Tax=Capillimicrobium parvum TaxID=2884022 RepID=A0A9E7C2F1_9ACTN|nr:adenylate/guanylate cyclase domain-containing protein [Capillimicrobium parvum]UGS37572.1 Putative aminoacrylate hydrolase RutD [Capillimicrobium parvum]
MVPRTQYARNGDVSLAYQVVGDGPVDLLLSMGFVTHVELVWEAPGLARYIESLSRHTRLIIYDRRGTGMSDPVTSDDVWVHAADLGAVLEAAGSERVALLGYTTGGPVCIAFAAAHPERVSHLILYGAFATNQRSEEVHWTLTAEERQAVFHEQIEHWGEGLLADRVAPSCADDPQLCAWFARLERLAASPGTARASVMGGVTDVTAQLRDVRTPTLVLHRTGDTLIDVRHGRYMAEKIPGARLVELPGTDSLPSSGDSVRLVAEMLEFVSGGPVGGMFERALRTVLFTDICDATGLAARLGDARWRSLLGAHDRAVDVQLARHGGRRVKSTGDGVLATFAGLPSDAVRYARDLVEQLADLGIEARVGLHTGECELIGDDVGGMAVHIAARLCAMAGPGDVVVSGTVYGTVVGSGLPFRDLGMHELKGVSGRWPIFALEAG